MVPRKKIAPLRIATPEGGEAVTLEMVAAAIQRDQLTTYVSKKNLKQDRMIVSARVSRLTSELTRRRDFNQASPDES